MFHNFTFVENDNTHFIRWNPTSVDFGRKIRTILTPLDGPPIIHYQDTTEVIGSFVWENVPVKKRFQYNQIENLVGKSGVIYTNTMPQLTGYKNLAEYSDNDDYLNSGYWRQGCNGDCELDSSVLGPDGLSLVYLFTPKSTAPYAGCIRTAGFLSTLVEHNVISCYVKYGGASEIGINLYTGASNAVYFTFTGADVLEFSHTSGTVTDYGVVKVPNSDNWFRIWMYVRSDNSLYGVDFLPYIYPQNDWELTDIYSTYVTDIQVEQGVNKPTWFAKTTGTPIIEPLSIDFLDMKTDYLDLNGTVKHTLSLNFRLTGAYL